MNEQLFRFLAIARIEIGIRHLFSFPRSFDKLRASLRMQPGRFASCAPAAMSGFHRHLNGGEGTPVTGPVFFRFHALIEIGTEIGTEHSGDGPRIPPLPIAISMAIAIWDPSA